MSDEFLGERKRVLEEEFFRKREKALRERMQAEATRQGRQEALAAASGISDPAIVQHLVDLGLEPDTLLALRLVPLVEVAWADGSLDQQERAAVLGALSAAGIAPGSAARALVEGWLAAPPGPELREAWTTYTRSLVGRLQPAERADLRRAVVDGARAVAQAAGGFLGLGSKVSAAEEEVLRQLEAAFSA
jgi:hypothetical protein